jgi:hypothetical protein
MTSPRKRWGDEFHSRDRGRRRFDADVLRDHVAVHSVGCAMTDKPDNPPAFPQIADLLALRAWLDQMHVTTYRARIYDSAETYFEWGAALDRAIAILNTRKEPTDGR